KTVKIEATAVGRHAVDKLQLVHNGRVVKTQTANPKEPGRIRLIHELSVDEPGWFAVRADGATKNEFDKTEVAHSSPIYVTFKGRNMFDVDAALGLLKQVEEGQAAIKARARFSDDAAARNVLALYDEAVRDLRQRINSRK